MKVLIFSGYNDFSAIDKARDYVNDKHDVYVIQCDSCIRVCSHNILGSSAFCKLCHKAAMNAWRENGLLDEIKIESISEIITADILHNAEKFNTEFNSIAELKGLTYRNIPVGYGAFSTYVTASRNVMPEISKEFEDYISFMIRKEVATVDALYKLVEDIHPDLMCFHSGRFALYKPWEEVAENLKINFIATEHAIRDGKFLRNYFENDIPHSIEANLQKIEDNWTEGQRMEDVEEIGKSFYEKRRKGIAAGDKVYIKDQKKGLLPEGWNDGVENISIFNSSEDEFCAISKEFDSYLLFPTQFEAMKAIFEHYKDDKSKHFYVRIHPNLKNVPFKSHLGLYELHYENVTFIRPESPISSYDLMEHSSKIIVFNSTMGMESTYWRKPVICLTYFYYSALDCVYTPKSEEDVWRLIDTKGLPDKYNHNVIKYGYWLLKQNYPPVQTPHKLYSISLGSRKFQSLSIMKIFGSGKLFLFLETIMQRIHIACKFGKLPSIEPYKG